MDLITYILFIIIVTFFIIMAVKLVWFLLPFIIILLGVSYLRIRYLQNKRVKEFKEYGETIYKQAKPENKIKDDVIDVEYTVRDADDQ